MWPGRVPRSASSTTAARGSGAARRSASSIGPPSTRASSQRPRLHRSVPPLLLAADPAWSRRRLPTAGARRHQCGSAGGGVAVAHGRRPGWTRCAPPEGRFVIEQAPAWGGSAKRGGRRRRSRGCARGRPLPPLPLRGTPLAPGHEPRYRRRHRRLHRTLWARRSVEGIRSARLPVVRECGVWP